MFDGRKYSYSSGTSYLNIFINDPPENGTCTVSLPGQDADGNDVYLPAETGQALLHEFQLKCQEWRDPNDHAIIKTVFKIVEVTAKGNVTTMLYAGPLAEAKVVFPVGEFRLFAEIHEEAGAYAVYDILPKFSVYLPDEDDYNAFDFDTAIKDAKEVGNQDRVSQLLQVNIPSLEL